MKNLFSVGALLVFLAFSATPAFASAIAIDGSWHEFLFGGVGSFATTCGVSCSPTINPVADVVTTPPWTFTGAATLQVLDLFSSVDRFQVFDNAVSLGLTSLNTDGGLCSGDIACSLADLRFSRGTFLLAPGSHSITIQMNVSGLGGGAAVLRASEASVVAPEPTSLVLLGVGVGFLGFVSRRKTGNPATHSR